MKRLLIIMIAVLHSQSFMSHAMITGLTQQTIIISPTQTSMSMVPFASDTQSYVNGGITFTYPAGLFTQAPYVVIAVQLTGLPYSTSQQVTTVITSHSA